MTGYFCPDLTNVSEFSFEGTFASNSKWLVSAIVQPCVQSILDGVHPGKNMTCKAVDQAIAQFPFLMSRLYIKNQYLDISEFD